MRRLSARLVQIALLIGLWFGADRLGHALGWPIPGGVIGLGVLAALLFSGLLPLRWVQFGAEWLLAEMLLFFVPPLMAVVDAGPLMMQLGWRLVAVLVLGCLMVMVGTGLVVDWVFHIERRRRARKEGGDA